MDVAGASAAVRYIVTPDRAWVSPHLGRGGRAAGIAVSLYGVRSARNWGCGDFGDLLRVVDFAAEQLECGFVALNPLHAIHNRRPFNTSPYLPNCIFYQNFLYLDVEGMEDFARCRRAAAAAQSPAVAAEIAALRDAPFVEYERVSALKLRFLKLMFVQFLREWRTALGARVASSRRSSTARAICWKNSPLIARSTSTCTASIPTSGSGRTGRRPTAIPNRRKRSRFAGNIGAACCSISICSGRSTCNWPPPRRHARNRHLSIGLYHDLALATDSFGSDLWAHRPFYVAGCRVGSPPDDFSPQGAGLGLSAAQLRAAPRGRLPPVRRIHPQELPPRRRSAHRPRDASLPPLLDSRRQRRH